MPYITAAEQMASDELKSFNVLLLYRNRYFVFILYVCMSRIDSYASSLEHTSCNETILLKGTVTVGCVGWLNMV